MGTRNLTLVKEQSEYKIAQYGQWDGYPSGNGITVLEFCRDSNQLKRLRDNLSKVRFITDEECDEFEALESSVQEAVFQKSLWSRDIGADILHRVAFLEKESDCRLRNSLDFAKDSLFCEWAYCIDFDANKLEIYEGFNHFPLTQNDEFYFENYCDTSHDGTKFYPIKKIKEYDLSNLPTQEIFIRECDPQENDESDDTVDDNFKVADDLNNSSYIKEDALMDWNALILEGVKTNGQQSDTQTKGINKDGV